MDIKNVLKKNSRKKKNEKSGVDECVIKIWGAEKGFTGYFSDHESSSEYAPLIGWHFCLI